MSKRKRWRGGGECVKVERNISEMRYEWKAAYAVALSIQRELLPVCTRVTIAGSLRRGKSDVGDIEILYIPVMQEQPDPSDMFRTMIVSLADGRIEGMEKAGLLERRLNALGRETYGPLNKLTRHVASGIPVDLFAATEENWWNYLVCRTGPADLNTRICMAAQRKGWKWAPYACGFRRFDTEGILVEIYDCHSEWDVFDFVGLPYLPPERRA